MPNFYRFGFLWRSGKKIKCICYLWKNRRVLFLVFFWYLSTLLVKFSNTFAVFKTNTSKQNREKKLKTKTPNHTNLCTCSSWRLAVLHLALLIGANDYFALCILPGSLSVAGLSPATDNDPYLLGITWKSAIREHKSIERQQIFFKPYRVVTLCLCWLIASQKPWSIWRKSTSLQNITELCITEPF